MPSEDELWLVDEEMTKRMLAAGMYWDDKQQDWLPDPLVWYGDE